MKKYDTIENKTDAYDYLYYVFNGQIQKNPDLYLKAESFFTKKELLCLDHTPDFIFNNCFGRIAKRKCLCTSVDCLTCNY